MTLSQVSFLLFSSTAQCQYSSLTESQNSKARPNYSGRDPRGMSEFIGRVASSYLRDSASVVHPSVSNSNSGSGSETGDSLQKDPSGCFTPSSVSFRHASTLLRILTSCSLTEVSQANLSSCYLHYLHRWAWISTIIPWFQILPKCSHHANQGFATKYHPF